MIADKSENMQHIPLKSSYLCSDCEAVGNCSTKCPACAGESVMNMAVVLNRTSYLHKEPHK